VAKTASSVGVNQGSAIQLSTFTFENQRRRQTVIVGDAESASGEQSLLELPPNDETDRGSPVKIGGFAAATAPFVVDEADRVDAWFSLEGQQLVVATIEPAYVWDAGRKLIQHAAFAGLTINSGTGQVIAASPTLKTKVLGVNVQCVTFTTAGSLALHGSGTAIWVAQITAANQNFAIPLGSLAYYSTTVNTALSLHFTGNCAFNGSVIYYQAP
jgi:hypothetical protein